MVDIVFQVTLGSREDDDACNMRVDLEKGAKSKEISVDVPYTSAAGKVACSGEFDHYTDGDDEKIKYQVSED